jgi:hypothetical protein
MDTLGTGLRWAYRLRRHLWLNAPLSRWLGMLLLALGLISLLSGWPRPWLAGLFGLLFLAYLAALARAGRQGYARFEPAAQAQSLLAKEAAQPPLHHQEQVPVQASGLFHVEGKEQTFLDLDADFQTAATREHIVLGRVHPARFLLLGRWPKHELGWWYIFFQPAMIQSLRAGYLHFGPTPRLALEVVYAPEPETQRTIYLTSENARDLRRVWDDLAHDAPDPGSLKR